MVIRTHCVLNVNAAEVIDEGKFKPLITSCHNFLLMTSTRPPRPTTSLYSSYKSSTDLAIIGSLVTGVSANKWNKSYDHEKMSIQAGHRIEDM